MESEPACSEVPLFNSRLDQISSLKVDRECPFARLTGVICTIGPASRDVPVLEAMLDAGMNIARLNFSHGTHEYHKQTIDNIREAVDRYSKKIGTPWPVAIALDTRGSEIRTGILKGNDDVELVKGRTVRLTNSDACKDKTDSSMIYVDAKDLQKICRVGNTILIDDGSISLMCTDIVDGEVQCEVENTAFLGSYKGVSFPGVEVERSPEPTDRDVQDIRFAVENDLDVIFASFIPNAQAVREIRKVLGPRGVNMQVVAKIENRQAVANLAEIIEEADGLMVERGDLGSEIPTEKVFLAQKSMVARCNRAGKPVICATQMLESMTTRPRPTRAESADVANAVLDGVDCVMLSGETAKGVYPVQCVATMAAICREAEAAIWQAALFNDLTATITPPITATHTTAIACVEASLKCMAQAIIVLTVTGRSAKLIAKYRPKCPIIAITTSMKVARQCHLFRGLLPIYYPVKLTSEKFLEDLADHIDVGVKFGLRRGFLKTGDNIVTVTGWREGSGNTNTIHVSQV